MRLSTFNTIVCLKYRSKIPHESLCGEKIITEQKHLFAKIFFE